MIKTILLSSLCVFLSGTLSATIATSLRLFDNDMKLLIEKFEIKDFKQWIAYWENLEKALEEISKLNNDNGYKFKDFQWLLYDFIALLCAKKVNDKKVNDTDIITGYTRILGGIDTIKGRWGLDGWHFAGNIEGVRKALKDKGFPDSFQPRMDLTQDARNALRFFFFKRVFDLKDKLFGVKIHESQHALIELRDAFLSLKNNLNSETELLLDQGKAIPEYAPLVAAIEKLWKEN